MSDQTKHDAVTTRRDDPAPSPARREIKRAVTAASIGNFVEWFDFGFYGYLATTIAVVFFPSDDPTTALLATFAVFGAGFVARPLGAIYFGSVGDRLGRNKILAITVLIMSLATGLVGLLPSHATAGIFAPLALLVLRLIQGFAAGGEPGGAATFLAEYSPARRRGLTVSFWHLSSLAALICSSGLAFVLYKATTDEQMLSWGWRVPFLIAVPAGLIGLYLRLRIDETPEFKKIDNSEKVARTPLREVLKQNRTSLAKTFFLSAVQQFGFYTIFVYLASYAKAESGFDSDTGTLITIVTVLVASIVVAPFGALSDRIGRKPVLIGACIALGIVAVPMMAQLNEGSLATALTCAGLMAIPLGAFMGAAAATLPELFPTRRRYSGMSLAFGLAAAVFGGTAPYLSTWAIDLTDNPLAPGFLLIGVSVVSLVTAGTLQETARVDIAKVGQ